MTSYTSCIVLAILASMLMIAVNSDPSSQSELYENAYSKDDDYNLNKRPSFFVGSRYGRSPSQLYGTKTRRLNVAPRNDRFFLGSRYGKRSNEYVIPAFYDQQQQQQELPSSSLSSMSSSSSSSSPSFSSGVRTSESEQTNQLKDNDNYYKISCIYTGYKNYFKCNTINDISNNIFQQLSSDDANLI